VIIAWRDRWGWLNFVFLGDGRERERWEEMGEIVMRKWDLREFCTELNLLFLERQALLLIQRVKTLIWGLLNPFGQVIPLASRICSYPPYYSHLHPPSLFQHHYRRTQCQVILINLSMQWSWVHPECRIQRVLHTPSTITQCVQAYAEYSIHPRLSVFPLFSK